VWAGARAKERVAIVSKFWGGDDKVFPFPHLHGDLPLFEAPQVLHDDGDSSLGPRRRFVDDVSIFEEIFDQRRKQVRVEVGLVQHNLGPML
jgi:hypothetical protein